jgi:hypothetical protein
VFDLMFSFQIIISIAGDGQRHILQSDFATLKNVTAELEAAMDELQSAHCRRVLKYIK